MKTRTGYAIGQPADTDVRALREQIARREREMERFRPDLTRGVSVEIGTVTQGARRDRPSMKAPQAARCRSPRSTWSWSAFWRAWLRSYLLALGIVAAAAALIVAVSR